MPVLTRTRWPECDREGPLEKRKRRGATLMEYLMMVSLIITVCLVAIGYLGGTNNANMSHSSNQINKSLKKGS